MNLCLELPPEEATRAQVAVEALPRPLRVALVSGSYNYIKDGIALTLNRLVAFLTREGVEVLVFAPVAERPAFDSVGTVVPVTSVPLPFRPEYRVALGLTRAARERLNAFSPDIIHIAVPDLLGYGALKAAQEWNVPVVASYHTRYETYLRHYGLAFGRPVLERYLKSFYSACRELYVPSASMAETLRSNGLDVEMHVWTRGVDALRFSPSRRSESWRAQFGIGPDELVILFVSRLVREKQLSILAQVLEKLGEHGAPYRGVIVGDGPERARLQRLLPKTAFTGFLDGDDLATAYASSDVFLFPSDTESFGNVTLEAMASGLPCVCADATGSRSLVLHGRTGFLAKPGRVEEFTRYITLLSEDTEMRRTMATAAREKSLAFSWDEAMARVHGYYTSLLAGRHS